jgi:iron complex transport system substrate-binding protein
MAPSLRIVSLLPSATEIICAMGLGRRLVGVTHACDFPPRVRDLPKVTRTTIPPAAGSAVIDALVRESLARGGALYALDRRALETVRPDLIVTQALCEVCAVSDHEVRAAACALPRPARVLTLEPQTLGGVLDTIRAVGQVTGADREAADLVTRLTKRIQAVTGRTPRTAHRPRVALLEWLDPPFSSGHWSPELVDLAGGEEVLGRAGERSRAVSWEDVVRARPEVVVVACCGLDVARALDDCRTLSSVPGWPDVPAAASGRVHVVDGSQYFSRPGPRLVDSLELLAHALHPAVHPVPRQLAGALHGTEIARDPGDAHPGLCMRCRWCRTVTSRRGSRFVLCSRSREDGAFRKYPSLPVRSCAGFEDSVPPQAQAAFRSDPPELNEPRIPGIR